MISTWINRAMSVFAAVLLALCAGAVWSVVALLTRGQAPWMALIAAIVAAFGTSYLPWTRPWLRALVAATLTLISVGYAYFLGATSVISGSLDYGFKDTLTSIGPEMAWALSLARLTPAGAAWLLSGPLLAATIAWRTTRAR